MKYYSEKTNKKYDTIEELETAEKEFDDREAKELALREERKARAHEVEEAYKRYLELKAKFIQDYKEYHMTLRENDLPKLKDGSIIDLFFDRFFW